MQLERRAECLAEAISELWEANQPYSRQCTFELIKDELARLQVTLDVYAHCDPPSEHMAIRGSRAGGQRPHRRGVHDPNDDASLDPTVIAESDR